MLLSAPLSAAPTAPPRVPLQLSLGAPQWSIRPVKPAAIDVAKTVYVVRPGDTLRAIGEATGAGSEAIARENKLVAPYVVTPGQLLGIPGGRYHRVREGETGLAIAQAYAAPWRAILDANGLTDPFVLRVGQRLALPNPAKLGVEARAAAFRIDIDDILTGTQVAQVTKAPARSTPAAPPPLAAVVPSRFAWPASGRIVGRFGREAGGRVNQGIDIAAASGSPIVATAAGTVAYVGSGVPGYGGLILVRHPGDWISAYGRTARATVAKGQVVRMGQALGDASGEAPLHFELRRARRPVDPIAQLPRR